MPITKTASPIPKSSHVLDRVLVLEMVRVTEAAAIAASALIGRGGIGGLLVAAPSTSCTSTAPW